MHSDRTLARFTAHCRAHPTWFATEYLALLDAMLAVDDPAPGQAAWEMLVDRFVVDDGTHPPEGDRATAPARWHPRFV